MLARRRIRIYQAVLPKRPNTHSFIFLLHAGSPRSLFLQATPRFIWHILKDGSIRIQNGLYDSILPILWVGIGVASIILDLHGASRRFFSPEHWLRRLLRFRNALKSSHIYDLANVKLSCRAALYCPISFIQQARFVAQRPLAVNSSAMLGG
jgi:hypothetical protein